MDKRRQEELIAGYIAGTLDAPDRAALAEAVERDKDFLTALRFDIGMAEALERERYDEAERERVTHQARKQRRLWLKLLLISGLFVLLLVLLYRFLRPPVAPFTPQEGKELLDDVLAKARADGRLGTVAGSADWTALLATPITSEDELRAAHKAMQTTSTANGRCDDTDLALLLGAVEAYAFANFNDALAHLGCVDQDATYLYASEADLPTVLSLLGAGRVKEARERFLASAISVTALPPRARDLLAIDRNTE